MVIIYIYTPRAIFLLFSNHQDTESESQDMEICVAGPILNQKCQILYVTTIFTPHNMGEKYCGNHSY